jgi:hypothetical protein
VFIHEATEHFACLLRAFIFRNVPAMLTLFLAFNSSAFPHKLEKTVILTKTGKDRKSPAWP